MPQLNPDPPATPAAADMPTPPGVARKAIGIGVAKVSNDPATVLVSAALAGAFISIAFVFYTVVTTGNEGLGWGANRLMGGIAFSLGLMLVVVNGGELFTSSVLTVVARMSGRITTSAMLKNWGLVYLGNAFGALGFAGLLMLGGNHEMGGGAVGAGYLAIADHKLHHGFGEAVALGILCNFLVCLAIWMSFAARSLTDKLLAVVFPVAMFVAAGFEHSIANMFMVPMALMVKGFAGPEFWAGIGASPADYASLTWGQFLSANLLPVTLGNILGGAGLVGMSNWFVHLRERPTAARDERETTGAGAAPERAQSPGAGSGRRG